MNLTGAAVLNRLAAICKHVRNQKNIPPGIDQTYAAARNDFIEGVTGFCERVWRSNRGVSMNTVNKSADKLDMAPNMLLSYLTMSEEDFEQTLEQRSTADTRTTALVQTLSEVSVIKSLNKDNRARRDIEDVLKTGYPRFPPFVFYHWRQVNGRELHWLDVFFLATLSAIKSHGFQPQALINEIQPLSEFARALIMKLTGSPPISLNEAKKQEHCYETFLKKRASQEPDIYRSLMQLKPDVSTWLKFIPWWVVKQGRKGYAKLFWNNSTHAEKVDLLYRIRSTETKFKLEVALIETVDIYLGDKLAKKIGPYISIGPKGIDQFVLWLSSNPSPEQVHDFSNHLEEIERLCRRCGHLISSSGTLSPSEVTRRSIISAVNPKANYVEAAVKAGGILETLSNL